MKVDSFLRISKLQKTQTMMRGRAAVAWHQQQCPNCRAQREALEATGITAETARAEVRVGESFDDLMARIGTGGKKPTH